MHFSGSLNRFYLTIKDPQFVFDARHWRILLWHYLHKGRFFFGSGILRVARGWVRPVTNERQMNHGLNTVDEGEPEEQANRSIIAWNWNSHRATNVWDANSLTVDVGVACFQSARIHKTHRIVLHISIAIEGLRISRVVAAVVRVGLVEARVPAIVTTEHCFIAAIRVAFIAGELLRLKCGVATARGVGAPRVKLDGADNVAVDVRRAFALRHRVFVHKENAALLHGHQSAACVNIATLPNVIAVNLGDDLATEYTAPEVECRPAILRLLHA